MLVSFYSFSKKRNSTALPNEQGAVNVNCELKDDTSFINPVIILKPDALSAGTFSPALFNYCKIGYWQRYYFINDWQYVLGVWQAVLTVDVLASFRGVIGNTSAYVLRSASQHDGTIADILYPAKSGVTYDREFQYIPVNMTGFYIVGIISNSSDSNSDGAITYYAFTAAEMANFKAYLMSETFLSANGLSGNADLSKDLVKAILNPFQYIVSCKWFPLNYATFTVNMVSVTSINFGWWPIPMPAKMLTPNTRSCTLQDQNAIALGNHPQSQTRGVYLNHAPFTERVIMHPLFGTIMLDSNKINSGDALAVAFNIDFVTGMSTVVIDITPDGQTFKRLYMGSTPFAVDIPVAQISQDLIGTAKTAISSVGNIASGAIGGFATGGVVGGFLGAIGGAASGILDCVQAAAPILQTSGTAGNRSIFTIPMYIFSFYRWVVDEDNTDNGRPLCKTKVINTLSGFILCSNAHVSFNCTEMEREQIEHFMNSGFFYE